MEKKFEEMARAIYGHDVNTDDLTEDECQNVWDAIDSNQEQEGG